MTENCDTCKYKTEYAKLAKEQQKWKGRFWELCECVEAANLRRVRKALWNARKKGASVSELMDILRESAN